MQGDAGFYPSTSSSGRFWDNETSTLAAGGTGEEWQCPFCNFMHLRLSQMQIEWSRGDNFT